MENKEDKKIGPQRSRFTDQDIKTVYRQFDGNRAKAAEYWEIPAKTVSNWFLELEKDPKFKEEQIKNERKLYSAKPESNLVIIPKVNKVYVITSCQNDTLLHKGFYNALMSYCDYRNADLIVIPIRYKNPNAYTSPKDYHPKWPSELSKHYLNDNILLNENLVVMGAFKNQATAVIPLDNKLGAMATGRSAVIGHPQIMMKMVATPSSDYPRTLISTGSISMKNYSDTPMGDYGAFNHSFGATIVEVIDEKRFNTRTINATDDGSFYDIDMKSFSITKFNPTGTIETGYRAEALICGDIHAWFLDPRVKEATWTGKRSIFNICRPKHQFIHDAHDHYSQNHHHKNDPFQKVKKVKDNKWLVEDELNCLADLHNEVFNDSDCEYHYIASNHNDALLRWLKESDWRHDPHNAPLQVELTHYMFKHNFKHPLYIWMEDKIKNPNNTHFHTRNEKIIIHGIDLGQHGDRGPNGSRGSARAFVNTGYKVVIGHSHTPCIFRGTYQVGTSSLLQLEYNEGYSSWLHTHCLVLPNGKRMLINIVDGIWCLDS